MTYSQHIKRSSCSHTVSGVLVFMFLFFMYIVPGLQTTALAQTTISGNFNSFVSEALSVMPEAGTNAYQLPNQEALDDFASVFENMLNSDYNSIQGILDKYDYEFVEYSHTGENPDTFYLIYETEPIQRGWGMYVIRPNYTTHVHVQVPHPLFDVGTPQVGARSFLRHNMRFFSMAGAHRYANGEPGTNPESDVARYSQDGAGISIFQKAHEIWSDAPVLQLHGFNEANDIYKDYPEVVISNGTTEPQPVLYVLRELLVPFGITGGVYDRATADDLSLLAATGNKQRQWSTDNEQVFVHYEMATRLRDTDNSADPNAPMNQVISTFGDAFNEPLKGTFYVGPKGTAPGGVDPDFKSLREMLLHLSGKTLNGDVDIYITDDLEEQENVFFAIDAAPHTVTIQPMAGATPTVSFTNNTGNSSINGAFVIGAVSDDWGALSNTTNLVIDGSNNGINSRDLTFRTASGSHVSNFFRIVGNVNNLTWQNTNVYIEQPSFDSILLSPLRTNDTDWVPSEILIKNNHIVSNAGRSSSRAINIWGVTGAIFQSIETAPGLVHIKNNDIIARRYGVWLRTMAGETKIDDNTIKMNETGTLHAYGILVSDTAVEDTDIEIINNKIQQNQAGEDFTGISTETQAAYSIIGNQFTDLTAGGVLKVIDVLAPGEYVVKSNIMAGLRGDGGIEALSFSNEINGSYSATLINNTITGFESQGSPSPVYGIIMRSPESPETASLNMYHNTILMNPLQVSESGWNYRGLFLFSNARISADLRNNIFINADDNGEHVTSYAYFQAGSAASSFNSDNNLWFVAHPEQTNTWLSRHGAIGTNTNNLENHQTNTGKDAASVSKEVSFADVAEGDLRLVPPSDGDGDLAGVVLRDDDNNIIVSTDIDGRDRDAENPYRGAFEGLRLSVEELTTQLAGAAGYRMLSAPTAVTLQDLLSPIWTQGVQGGNSNENDDEPNVFIWDNTAEGNEATNWQPADLTNTATPGTGFLVYVFDNDNPEDETGTEGFPKTLSTTAGEFPSGISATVNSNQGGWSLLGNPFGVSIDFNELGRTNLSDVVYIWDVNNDDGREQSGEVNPGAGSWKSYSAVGSAGDITDGIIAPFQGFFVQNSDGGTASVSFPASARTSNGAPPFLGKTTPREVVRLELFGQGMGNAAWLSFAGDGSFDKTRGDAWQLRPLSEDFAVLAGVKPQGLMDISLLPQPGEDFEFALHTETSLSGTYTLRVTDLGIEQPHALMLEDRLTGTRIALSEGMEYTFELEAAVNKQHSDIVSLGANELVHTAPVRKADSSIAPRFYIVSGETVNADLERELPAELTLSQNYPNPFNPSTVISYTLPEQSRVQLTVFDMLGRQVSVLVDERQTAGSHRVTWDASTLSSGVYLYRLQADGQTLTRTMTLIK